MRVIFRLICQADEKHKEFVTNQNVKENRLLLKKFNFFKEIIKSDFTYGELIKKVNLEKNRARLNAFFQRYGHPEFINLNNCFCCDLTKTE